MSEPPNRAPDPRPAGRRSRIDRYFDDSSAALVADQREITLASRRIADDAPAFVIAEIGSNHQGDIRQAEDLIRAAALAGADAVKFQKRDNRSLYTPEEYEAPYHSEHAFGPTYGEHREALELDRDQYQHLKAFAESFGLVFFATAFDVTSMEFLARLEVPVIKIGSGQATNAEVLTAAAQVGVPLIVSTGGCSVVDIHRSAIILREHGASFALLHCVSIYPCPAERLNLGAISVLRKLYPSIVIGHSDHYDGPRFAELAWSLGARIFEKHFTLDRSAKGSDNAFSLEPAGLTGMVKTLGLLPLAIGDGRKCRLPEEVPALQKMGRRDL